jgi:hypothetical protein
MKRKKKAVRRADTSHNHRVREFDAAAAKTELRLRAGNVDAALRKLDEAKTVKQETMQFEFSV